MCVNFEFLYGIKSAWATNFSITRPKFDNDKFILLPSFNLSPVAKVLDYLSLPAKSTNDNLPYVIKGFNFYSVLSVQHSTTI